MNESIKPDVPYLLPAGEGPGYHTLPPAMAGPGLLAPLVPKSFKGSRVHKGEQHAANGPTGLVG